MATLIAGTYAKMQMVKEAYSLIEKKLDQRLKSETGVATYYFDPLFPFLCPECRAEWPPSIGLVLSADLFNKLEQIKPLWQIYPFHNPKNTKRYVAVSAHNIDSDIAIEFGFSQHDLGAMMLYKTQPMKLGFKSMYKKELEEFIRNYQYPRDFWMR